MKRFLIFVAVTSAAHGGSRKLSPQESIPGLQNFQKLCASGRVRETGAFVNLEGENTWVYCKQAGGRRVVENTEETRFEVAEPPPQTVFVSPSDVTVQQKVLVTGAVRSSRTKIYYVPPKVDTELNVDVKSQTEKPGKPTVYFLSRGDDDDDGAREHSSSSSSEPLTPPRGYYLPPRRTPQDEYVGAAGSHSPQVSHSPHDEHPDDVSDSSSDAAKLKENTSSSVLISKREALDSRTHAFKVNQEIGKPVYCCQNN